MQGDPLTCGRIVASVLHPPIVIRNIILLCPVGITFHVPLVSESVAKFALVVLPYCIELLEPLRRVRKSW